MARAASGPTSEGSFRSFLGLQQQRGCGLRSVFVFVALLLAVSAADARLLPLEDSLEGATGGGGSGGSGSGGGGAARRLLECGQCPPAGEAQSRCQALNAEQRDSIRNSLLASCPGPALSGGCCAALPAQGTADWENWAACMCAGDSALQPGFAAFVNAPAVLAQCGCAPELARGGTAAASAGVPTITLPSGVAGGSGSSGSGTAVAPMVRAAVPNSGSSADGSSSAVAVASVRLGGTALLSQVMQTLPGDDASSTQRALSTGETVNKADGPGLQPTVTPVPVVTPLPVVTPGSGGAAP